MFSRGVTFLIWGMKGVRLVFRLLRWKKKIGTREKSLSWAKIPWHLVYFPGPAAWKKIEFPSLDPVWINSELLLFLQLHLGKWIWCILGQISTISIWHVQLLEFIPSPLWNFHGVPGNFFKLKFCCRFVRNFTAFLSIFVLAILKKRSTWRNDNFDNWAWWPLRHFCHQDTQGSTLGARDYFPMFVDNSWNAFSTERRNHVLSRKR